MVLLNRNATRVGDCYSGEEYDRFREVVGVNSAGKLGQSHVVDRRDINPQSMAPSRCADEDDPGSSLLGWNEAGHARLSASHPFDAQEICAMRRTLVRSACLLTRNSADAEDIVQSAFLRALERATPPEPTVDWRAWLGTVVRRMTIDLARRNQRWQHLGASDPNQIAAPAAELPPRWSNVTLAQVQVALGACDPRFRQVYELFYVQGLSQGQIATRLKIPLRTVASRLYRARAQIRRALERFLDRDSEARPAAPRRDRAGGLVEHARPASSRASRGLP
jgi:RNA polymerase sigma-70 factor (ECF subfamily)